VSAPAELSSLIATLDDLVRRFSALGEDAQARHDEETATEMFAAERTLQATIRRLRRLGEVRR
jgi:hypothetical protein